MARQEKVYRPQCHIDGSPACFDMCHLRFAALAWQQALYDVLHPAGYYF